MNPQEYYASLPKKRMGAGCLFFDRTGRLLLLKPTYKDYWLLPGGVVEANESPLQACIREIKEEIGIEYQPQRLLCIDYVSANKTHSESLQFVFLGGVIDPSKIKLNDREIAAYEFLKKTEAILKLGFYSQRRIGKCLEYLESDRTLYLENQEIV